MTFIPSRRQTPFASHATVNFHPAGTADSPDKTITVNPAQPDTHPADLIVEKEKGEGKPDPVPSGQISDVPDGWITRTEAQERLKPVGIEIDSRRIRHLCARNELENKKVRNEKNQPQYFINPASLDQYIASHRSADASGHDPAAPDISPDQTLPIDPAVPDNMLDENLEQIEKTDPAVSGQADNVPDTHARQKPEGEWVPKSQLDQAMAEIEFMREEIRDGRQLKRDLKAISSEMLETFAKVAQSNNRQLPPQQPQPIRYSNDDLNRAGQGE